MVRKVSRSINVESRTLDMYQLTAAHRSLPIPSFVRVTNLENGKATVVRVNDRGPFHSERIIDLSYAAAVKLGFHEQGTQVLVEALSADSPPVAAPLLQVGEYPGRYICRFAATAVGD